MKSQSKPKPVMTIKKVTKKVTGPMPKTKVVSPKSQMQTDFIAGKLKKK